MTPRDHDYFAWLVSDGVPWIHAAWPAYPTGEKWQWRAALINLGSFPSGTQFTPIDDIDKCILLRVRGFESNRDPFDERGYHVSTWHETLHDLHDRSLIELDGIEFVTYRQHEKKKLDDLRDAVRKQLEKENHPIPQGDLLTHVGAIINGKFVPMRLDLPEDEDDGIPSDRSWLVYGSTATVQLTDKGWDYLEGLWSSTLNIPAHIRARISPIIEHGLYDTAIRELGVHIESAMRNITGTRNYGQRLIGSFIDHLLEDERHDDWSLKVLRTELRTAMKFIRNEFAHNIVDLPPSRALALISRMCHVINQIDEVVAVVAE